MHFAMKNGQICFSLRKFLAISSAIQKIASDCGCDAVVHLAFPEGFMEMVPPMTSSEIALEKVARLSVDRKSRQILSRLAVMGTFPWKCNWKSDIRERPNDWP